MNTTDQAFLDAMRNGAASLLAGKGSSFEKALIQLIGAEIEHGLRDGPKDASGGADMKALLLPKDAASAGFLQAIYLISCMCEFNLLRGIAASCGELRVSASFEHGDEDSMDRMVSAAMAQAAGLTEKTIADLVAAEEEKKGDGNG